MKLAVIGTGYVGLVTGATFADFGHEVTCIDIDKQKIKSLKKNVIPFYEPGLTDIVKKNNLEGRLNFVTSYKEGLLNSDVVFICVGTPPKDDGGVNLEYLNSAIKETVLNLSDKFTLIVIKSTVPVGVEEKIADQLGLKNGSKFEFASNPEFLKEGSAVYDAQNPDRIVIGVQSDRAKEVLLELYKDFNCEVIVTDVKSAQLIKYTSNSFLATKISFANAVARLSDELGANVEDVLKGVGLDKRIGPAFLRPGVGYGGSCFPKDVFAFKDIFKEYGLGAELLEAVEFINKTQINYFLDKIKMLLGDLKGKTVTLLGLAFKPNTDDIREAPSIQISQKLTYLGAKVNAYDPVAMDNFKKWNPEIKINYFSDPYLALKGSDVLLLITEWSEFKELDLEKVKSIMKQKVIVDGRNLFDPKKVRELGFKYLGIGRN